MEMPKCFWKFLATHNSCIATTSCPKIERAVCAKQENNVDCGIYVVAFSSALASGSEVTADPIDIELGRQVLYVALVPQSDAKRVQQPLKLETIPTFDGICHVQSRQTIQMLTQVHSSKSRYGTWYYG